MTCSEGPTAVRGTERPVCTVGNRGGLVRPRTPESSFCLSPDTLPEGSDNSELIDALS
jgi:hypothetical protein